jgi:hypothetical protein
MDHANAPLSEWQNFYVIVGSAAGALTGLQFVVITLIAQARAARSMREIRAFGTPTVVHFCTALLLSALMTAPWRTLEIFAACLAAGGISGIVYFARVLWHARASEYSPDVEDWFWYVAFPFAAHACLLITAALFFWKLPYAAAVLAANSVFFILLGVHNAWDTVTYIAVQRHNATGSGDSSAINDTVGQRQN